MLIVLTLSIWTIPARADTPSTELEIHFLPTPVPCWDKAGHELRGYTLTQFQDLLRMDAQLWKYMHLENTKDAQIASLEQANGLLKQMLKVEELKFDNEETRAKEQAKSLDRLIVANARLRNKRGWAMFGAKVSVGTMILAGALLYFGTH